MDAMPSLSDPDAYATHSTPIAVSYEVSFYPNNFPMVNKDYFFYYTDGILRI